jgi:integrase
MAGVLPFKKTQMASLTETQGKIWEVLQEETNRVLPIWKICQQAGYSSTQVWYSAMRDKTFRRQVEALGVVVQRQHQEKNSVGKVPLATDPDEEWLKDIVDIRRLVADYPKHMAATFFKVDFSGIRNPGLRNFVKRYFRARIGFWEPRTFKGTLISMMPFLTALGETHPHIDSFTALNRTMIEPLLTRPIWTDSVGRIQVISAARRHRMVTALNTMFTYMQRYGWDGAPTCLLLYEEDWPKLSWRSQPRPIPPGVFEQIQNHLDLLPPYARNLATILSITGLRTEDAVHLTDNCLAYDAAGDPRLHWYNHKLKREGRPLPITTEVADAIQRQRGLVKNTPDLFEKRYLFRTNRGIYGLASFCLCLNQLAEQIPILGPDQQVYHFTPHQFRHTVGSQMINGGMGIADVMAYLDHMSPEMTLRYAEINDETLKHKFKALVLSGQAVGGAALKALKEQLEQGDESELDWVVANLRKLSLPWGQCLHHAKANKCPYGQNACFTKDNGPCHKLVTTPEHAPVIIATMEDLKKSKQIADKQGWEMYASDLADQIRGMQQVLAELHLPADQRPKNRGGTK